jgi:hypothetical protein
MSEMPSRQQRCSISLLVALWPFAYFSDFVFPKNGTIRVVGNDFEYLYFRYKYYLLDELSRFHLPLWSPSEAAGYPFLVNPFAQVLYPLNVPFAAFYRIAGGIHFADYQAYAVLGISIYALGTYHWLRALGLPLAGSVVSSLIVPVSFRLAELLRFPNAIHAAAWMPWTLWAITRLVKTGRTIRYGAAVSGFVILLVTAGYPYFAFYSIFLFVPYGLIIWLPGFVDSGKARSLWAGAFGVLGCILTGPYLIKMQQMLAATTDRQGKSYAYSTGFPFYRQDTLGSLVYPPAASPEGWYYFGVAGLLLILYFLVWPNRVRSLPPFFTTWTFKLAMLGWFAFISVITYGDRSRLFRFLWTRMPGFASLRAWGRMNIVLLPLIAWLLAVAYEAFAERLTEPRKSRTRTGVELLMLVVPYLGILMLQFSLADGNHFHPYWDVYVQIAHPDARSFLTNGLCAFAALLLVWLSSRFRPWRSPWAHAVLAALVVVLSIRDIKPVGNFAWSGGTKRYPSSRQELNVAKKNRDSFSVPRTEVSDSLPLTASFNVGVISNWDFERYVTFLRRAQSEPVAKQRLLGIADGRKIFFSRSIAGRSIRSYLETELEGTYRVVKYDGDHLVVDVESPESGYVSFIDNWDPNWRASVDGQPIRIELLFGTFKSVPIGAGRHRVVFSYGFW